MISRSLLILPFFFLIVGGGTVWLLYNINKRKKLLQSLLTLPKSRRLFWYLLRRSGFRITSLSASKEYTLLTDGNPAQFTLKSDFTAVRRGRKYVCLFHNGDDERETIKQFFIYTAVFNSDGVVFFYEDRRKFSVFE